MVQVRIQAQSSVPVGDRGQGVRRGPVLDQVRDSSQPQRPGKRSRWLHRGTSGRRFAATQAQKGSKAEGRNSQLYREFSEATRSADQQAALDRAMSAGLSPDEVERTAKSAEDAARTPQSFFLAEPDPGSGIYFDSDHNGLAAALETASLELARDARPETILIRHTTHDGHASDGFYSMIVGGRPPDKKIEDRPPDGWLPLDTFVDARLRTFIADSFFNINGKRLKFDSLVKSLCRSN